MRTLGSSFCRPVVSLGEVSFREVAGEKMRRDGRWFLVQVELPQELWRAFLSGKVITFTKIPQNKISEN